MHSPEISEARSPTVHTKEPHTSALSQRICAAFDYAGLNKHAAARELGKAYTTVTAWCDGISAPNGDNLTKIIELTGVNGEWLLTGTGEMVKTPSHAPPPPDSQAVKDYLTSARGADTTPELAEVLLRVPWTELGLDRPSSREISAVRDLLADLRLHRRRPSVEIRRRDGKPGRRP